MADETTNNSIPFPNNWMIASDFDPKEHLMNLKGKDYLNVQGRLLWFIRDQRALIAARLATMPFSVTTELVEHDTKERWAQFKTTVRDVLGNESTMYGSESAKDFTDYLEKASTKSLGRALLNLGYGTAFAPEMDEGERVVDAPVKHSEPVQQRAQPAPQRTPIRPQPAPTPAPAPAPAPVVEEPVAEKQPREGMTPEESARFDALIAQYDKDFIRWAIRETGFVPNPGDNRPQRQQMTEDQIAVLFDCIEDWYTEWLAQQQAEEETPATTAAPIEPAEEPVEEAIEETPAVDEAVRIRELTRALIDTYATDTDGKPNSALLTAAYQYILPQVPVAEGEPRLDARDLQAKDSATGRPVRLPALLVQRAIPLKVFNDKLEDILADDPAFIQYMARSAEFLASHAA